MRASLRIAMAGLVYGAAVMAACSRPAMLGGARGEGDLARAAPDSFLVAFETSRGRFDVMAHKGWAPIGVDRFYDLVRRRYYDDVYFYRVVKNFVAQFGLSGDSAINAAWRIRRIADDSVRHSNTRGTLSFARSMAATRTVQLFINLRDNARLDADAGFGFPAFAEVVKGMSVVDSLYQGYGDSQTTPRPGARPDTTRRGPPQDSIVRQGNAYLRRAFPKLDRVITARIVREWRNTGGKRPR